MRSSFSRFLILTLCLALPGWAQPSPKLLAALEDFRTEGPKGWAFTQTSISTDRSRVETYDPLQASHLRWNLITENGEAPSSSTLESYRQQQTRRTGGNTAPNVKEQLILETAELRVDDGERQQWHFRLKPGAEDDRSAEHMASTLTFHVPTATIEKIELASFEEFNPVFGVTVESARTLIEYSLPIENRPSLLQKIEVSIRGDAFYFKSIDSDMVVSYSDYEYRGKN
ncbi:MAG: hypothetical protein SynsKO_24730 [Synoicihabitans sp.]